MAKLPSQLELVTEPAPSREETDDFECFDCGTLIRNNTCSYCAPRLPETFYFVSELNVPPEEVVYLRVIAVEDYCTSVPEGFISPFQSTEGS